MAHLRTLKLNKCRLARVDELACLQCLHSLEMQGNQLSNIRPLAALARLETLDVCANVIKDMSALATSLSLFKKLSSIGIKGKSPPLVGREHRPLHSGSPNLASGLTDRQPCHSAARVPLRCKSGSHFAGIIFFEVCKILPPSLFHVTDI